MLRGAIQHSWVMKYFCSLWLRNITSAFTCKQREIMSAFVTKWQLNKSQVRQLVERANKCRKMLEIFCIHCHGRHVKHFLACVTTLRGAVYGRVVSYQRQVLCLLRFLYQEVPRSITTPGVDTNRLLRVCWHKFILLDRGLPSELKKVLPKSAIQWPPSVHKPGRSI